MSRLHWNYLRALVEKVTYWLEIKEAYMAYICPKGQKPLPRNKFSLKAHAHAPTFAGLVL